MLDLSNLRAAVRAESGVSRRLFLAHGAALSALPLIGGRAEARTGKVVFAGDPFSLGVASGDPTDSGVIQWTRLAPKPLDPDGGLPPEAVELAWELATDDGMRNVIRRGTAVATPQLAHSVHVEVDGLAPDRWYWYRFLAGDAASPVGRARTTPRIDRISAWLVLTGLAKNKCLARSDNIYRSFCAWPVLSFSYGSSDLGEAGSTSKLALFRAQPAAAAFVIS